MNDHDPKPEQAIVRTRIFRESPYDGFPISDYPPHIDNMDSFALFRERLIEIVRPSIIVEVGTWSGASAIHMAQTCKRLGINCSEILCVDTWLGDPDIMISSHAALLNRRFGYPQLYFTFISNVLFTGCEDVITPVPLSSDAGFYLLESLGVKADLIYLDASHKYESVQRDLELYWRLLSDQGLICGHDYFNPGAPGVKRAVDEFAQRQSLPVIVEPSSSMFAIDPVDRGQRLMEAMGIAVSELG